MQQVELDLTFKPTGAAEWLLSFRETRRELRCARGLDVHATLLCGYAASVSGERRLIDQALCGLVDRGMLAPMRYAPWFRSPVFPPDPAYGCGGPLKASAVESYGWEGRRTPAWMWVFRVSADISLPSDSPTVVLTMTEYWARQSTPTKGAA